MRNQILEVLRKSNRELRAREIAPEIQKWSIEVAVELGKMEDEGLVISTPHSNLANGEYYSTWRIA